MDCEQARQLFDAYLDGELGSALATELGAHRLRCADCRQALALLEVSEHLIASDPERRELRSNFTNRLLACMDLPDEAWRVPTARPTAQSADPNGLAPRLRRGLIWMGVSAAAAMVALAFLGAFDRRGDSRVAGLTVLEPSSVRRAVPEAVDPGVAPGTDVPVAGADMMGVSGGAVLGQPSWQQDPVFEEWVGRVRTGIETRRKSLESLRDALERLDRFVPSSEAFLASPADPSLGGLHPEPEADAALPIPADAVFDDGANELDASEADDDESYAAPDSGDTMSDSVPSHDEAAEPAADDDSSYDDEESDEPVQPSNP